MSAPRAPFAPLPPSSPAAPSPTRDPTIAWDVGPVLPPRVLPEPRFWDHPARPGGPPVIALPSCLAAMHDGTGPRASDLAGCWTVPHEAFLANLARWLRGFGFADAAASLGVTSSGGIHVTRGFRWAPSLRADGRPEVASLAERHELGLPGGDAARLASLHARFPSLMAAHWRHAFFAPAPPSTGSHVPALTTLADLDLTVLPPDMVRAAVAAFEHELILVEMVKVCFLSDASVAGSLGDEVMVRLADVDASASLAMVCFNLFVDAASVPEGGFLVPAVAAALLARLFVLHTCVYAPRPCLARAPSLALTDAPGVPGSGRASAGRVWLAPSVAPGPPVVCGCTPSPRVSPRVLPTSQPSPLRRLPGVQAELW